MHIWQSLVLGIVEGLTEFLPVSSTGHLTVVERLMGLPIDNKSITGFTAVIQVGAIIAVIIYFAGDIWRLLTAWFAGLGDRSRRSSPDYRLGWVIIVGTIPIGIAGLVGKDLVTGSLRNLWWVAGALIAWSFAMVAAERVATFRRGERDLGLVDGLVIGVVQVLSLIPGVSRSGATISAGLAEGFDRVTATRFSFFLSIPALIAAGAFELPDALGGGVGAAPTLVGTVVALVVAYLSVAWFMRFVARHTIDSFSAYRVLAGLVVIGLLVSHTVPAH